jgi:hypothetical protein
LRVLVDRRGTGHPLFDATFAARARRGGHHPMGSTGMGPPPPRDAPSSGTVAAATARLFSGVGGLRRRDARRGALDAGGAAPAASAAAAGGASAAADTVAAATARLFSGVGGLRGRGAHRAWTTVDADAAAPPDAAALDAPLPADAPGASGVVAAAAARLFAFRTDAAVVRGGGGDPGRRAAGAQGSASRAPSAGAARRLLAAVGLGLPALPPMDNGYQGRGRGAGRPWMSPDPSAMDPTWWQKPGVVGPDPFMQGWSSKVYPRVPGGLGGTPGTSMTHQPYGGWNANYKLWGATYSPAGVSGNHYPYDVPEWRGRAFSMRERSTRPSPFHGNRYMTPRDSFGLVPEKKLMLWQGGGAKVERPKGAPVQPDWYVPAAKQDDFSGGDEEEEG